MTFQLRPYQSEIIQQTRTLMREGQRSILIQSPTGSGKTALTAEMLGNAAAKGMPSLFIVHRRELVKQSMRTFERVGIRYGVIAAGFFEDYRQPIQICSVQTVGRRLRRIKKPRLVVWDECHHVAAGTWSTIYDSQSQARHVGLTATPERLDGRGLNKWFTSMVKGPDVSWLIENKFLADYRLYAPSTVSLAGVHTRMGDFVKSELSAAVDKPTITGDVIRHYQRYAGGKRAVVFCVSIEHSKHVVAQFQAAGIPAAHVDGETDGETRDREIQRFERGETLVLSNVELFGEGFDLPAIEAAILLRPTQSLGLYLQQVGRALRPSEGKANAIILDHAGNCERHGLPDEPRDWTLLGRGEKKQASDGSSASVKICPKCFAAQFSVGRPACKLCGHVFETKPREIEHVDGELVEVDPAAVRLQRAREQGRAESLQDLIALGRRRGYKKPEAWAHHIFRYRQARKLAAGRVG